ncbi:NADH-quinone oxidoreductase subunit H, partial [Desulfobotulus sp. H1]
MDTAFFPPELLRMLIAALFVVAAVFVNALFMVYAERKIAGHIQRRPGPYEVGWHGLLQTLVDGIKLMTKELVVPRTANRLLFRMAPLLAFTPVVMPFLVLPFSENLIIIDLDIGLIFILTMASLNVMAILVAGWSSNNKYGLFGAMRSVAQNIAYEIPILLSLLSVVLITNSFSM